MIKKAYQASINITKPKDEVFTFTSDPNNLPLWSGASEVEVISETHDKLGSTYKVTFSSFLKKTTILIKIISYNFPDSWAFETEEEPVSSSNYKLEEIKGGTKVTFELIEDRESDSIITDMAIKRKMEKLLANLKNSLEE